MTVKLTLTIDEEVILKAKEYARNNRTSVSRLVEGYLERLTSQDEEPEELSGVVAELAGVLKGVDVEQLQREYAGYLSRKYR